MKQISFALTFLIISTTLAGCIKNDIPYPTIHEEILSIAARGETQPAEIDSKNLTATVYISEQTDIQSVSFSEFTYSEQAECSVNLLEGQYDLSSPIKITLSRYQDYEWEIRAIQNIERYFSVEGQIGNSEIDPENHTVKINVTKGVSLSSLKVTSIKLGNAGVSTMTPFITSGSIIDLSSPLKISVTAFGRTQEWTVSGEISDDLVSTTRVDAWSQVIWAYAQAPADAPHGFQYREETSDEWIDVPDSRITSYGATYQAMIPHLQPLTKYIVRAVSGNNTGNEIAVTTQATADLTDGNFDQWWLKNNKIWCPWNQDGIQYWDTGNTGASTLGQSNVTPTSHVPASLSGQAAMLETKFVGIGPLGKLATGSIYTGYFKRLDGTNGILSFGREFDLRPTALEGYFQYKSTPINYTSSELTHLKNSPDICHIYVVLADWTEPFEIRTNPKNRNLIDPDAPEVIAYGSLERDSDTDGYIPFRIELKYKDTSRKPKYLVICAASSKYGDYFTGGDGSVLYVDQFSLKYDY